LKSIVYPENRCAVCGSVRDLQTHHIWGGSNRKLSDHDGLTCRLCRTHHTDSPTGVHFNKELDIKLKQEAERKWLEVNNKAIPDFIKRYGRNLL